MKKDTTGKDKPLKDDRFYPNFMDATKAVVTKVVKKGEEITRDGVLSEGSRKINAWGQQIKTSVAQRRQEAYLGISREECEQKWKVIQKKKNFEELQNELEERAQQWSIRKQAVERSNIIQNAYFAMGGIYSQLDRLSESFEMAEATGQDVSIGVVYTILLELDHDLKKLADKITNLEQSKEKAPEYSRQDQQILDLWHSIESRMDRRESLGSEELAGLQEDMDHLSSKLDQQQVERALPDFPEGWESEKMWQALQELIKILDLDALDSTLESDEERICVREQAEKVRGISETRILPHWNRYPDNPQNSGFNQESSGT